MCWDVVACFPLSIEDLSQIDTMKFLLSITLLALAATFASAHLGEFSPNLIEGELMMMKDRKKVDQIRRAAANLGATTAPGRYYTNWLSPNSCT